MMPAEVKVAFDALSALFPARPELADALRLRWRAGGRDALRLPEDVRAPADLLGDVLPELAPEALVELGAYLKEPGPFAEILFT